MAKVMRSLKKTVGMKDHQMTAETTVMAETQVITAKIQTTETNNGF